MRLNPSWRSIELPARANPVAGTGIQMAREQTCDDSAEPSLCVDTVSEASVAGAARSDEALLDVANRAIIEALQRDGRLPYAQIGQEVGLSEAAVRRRVNHLRETGVIEIVAVTDPLQLGFTRQAMIGIRVEGDVRRVASKIVPLPEVDYVVMCAGSFDLLVELVCEDDERLLHVLNDSIRSVPGVLATETFVYLKLAKQTYTWGTR
jgi:Lrp/AsnC family transcriptional regulator, regulator for asnA, asnC and gidA